MNTIRISDLIGAIKTGDYQIPTFQRPFEWDNKRIISFFQSMYKEYPLGGILIWQTKIEEKYIRGKSVPNLSSFKFIIDGQQRITALFAVNFDDPPDFYMGNQNRNFNLYFDLENEKFSFYNRNEMERNPFWISLYYVLNHGASRDRKRIHEHIQLKFPTADAYEKAEPYIERLEKISRLYINNSFYMDTLDDKIDLENVVEIFVAINTGSKKLSGSDLALAKLSTRVPDARNKLENTLLEWKSYGYDFSIEWLLKCLTTHSTGSAFLRALDDIPAEKFNQELSRTKKSIESLVYVLQSQLGLDNSKVIGIRMAFPLMVRYLALSDDKAKNRSEKQNKALLLYWYIQSLVNKRYFGSTETVLARDLNYLSSGEKIDEGIISLVNGLKREINQTSINWPVSNGFHSSNVYHQLLYILVRVCNAKDIINGDFLNYRLFSQPLEKHHIFPRRVLRDKYPKEEINDVANLAFMTKDGHSKIRASKPEEYLSSCENQSLKSHWIPTQKHLWKIENYPKFLSERRKLLSAAANKLLENLESGKLPHS